ncbi:MAG: polymerase, sigma-24 subunit, subfamily [Verrucomicrobiales bacterium]|nr:polymerase, sigma-24 subunit, subfamily [Verrucomicrobiales bacterium]
MTRSNLLCLGAVAISAIAVCLILQHRLHATLNAGELLRLRQEEQLATLTREHEQFSKRINSGQPTRPEDLSVELVRLRHEAEALKAQTNNLAIELKKTSMVAKPSTAPDPASRTPEFYEQLRKLAGNKPTEARDLASAFTSYARDHDSQCPATLDILNAYMAEQKSHPLSGSNHFEIVYHGSLEKLKGIPLQNVAVLREQSSWPGPDGTRTRLYGIADGSSQMVESNDDFKSWEAEHIISP